MPEIMDDLNCSGKVVEQTLHELETINRLLGGNAVTISGLEQLLRIRPVSSKRRITVADIGCGRGDMLNQIERWGKRRNYALDLTGIDANPNIVNMANKHHHKNPQFNFSCKNVFSDEFKSTSYDIITATLFTHHFTSEELVNLFKSLMSQARIGIVINDLHRHWLAYYSIKLLTRLFSKSEMVIYDAPLSVKRAFTRSEIIEILKIAGINNYTLRWKWAFRWQLVIPGNLA